MKRFRKIITTKSVDFIQSTEISNHIWKLHREARFLFNKGVEYGFKDKNLTKFDICKILTTMRNNTDWFIGTVTFQRASIINGLKSIRLAEKTHKNQKLPPITQSNLGMYFRKKGYYDNQADGSVRRQPAISSYNQTTILNGTFKLDKFRLILNTHEYDGLKPLSFQLVETTKKLTKYTTPSDRTYQINFQFEHTPPDHDYYSNQKMIGVDLGARTMMATADNSTHTTKSIKVPNKLKRFKHDKFDKMRSRLSKKKKKSRSYKDMHRRMSKKQQKLKNQQTDSMRKTIKSELESAGTVIIEELNIKTMTNKKKQAAKGMKNTKGINRTILNSAIGEKRDQIKRFCKMNGIQCYEVPARFTSQICHVCGNRDASSRNKDSFQCIACGQIYHADENAAINILIKYLDQREREQLAYQHSIEEVQQKQQSTTQAAGNVVSKQKDGPNIWQRSVWKEITNPVRFGNQNHLDPKDIRNAGTNHHSLSSIAVRKRHSYSSDTIVY